MDEPFPAVDAPTRADLDALIRDLGTTTYSSPTSTKSCTWVSARES
jgi:ABC-type nitrate/sulfonate/bicarbonate transport system ATPase subunit